MRSLLPWIAVAGLAVSGCATGIKEACRDLCEQMATCAVAGVTVDVDGCREACVERAEDVSNRCRESFSLFADCYSGHDCAEIEDECLSERGSYFEDCQGEMQIE